MASHQYQARAFAVQHTGPKDAIVNTARRSFGSCSTLYPVSKEMSCTQLNIPNRANVRDTSDSRFDIMFQNPINNHAFYCDVMVKELIILPKDRMDVDYNRFLDEGWTFKHLYYYSRYDMASESIIPLVMYSLDGIHRKSFEFLKQLSEVLAQRDKVTASKIMWHFRDSIAMALAKKQFRIYESLCRMHPRW